LTCGPVVGEPLVGGFGLGGELTLELVLLARSEDALGMAATLVALGAGEQLEPAQLLARQ
jgi:hypothetical protein